VTTALATLCACAGAAIVLGVPAAGARDAKASAISYYGKEIVRFQKETWYWQRVMGVRRTTKVRRSLTQLTPIQVRRIAEGWERTLHTAVVHAHRPPHLRQLLCIHRYEGSWTDAGAPYYGGLQMDVGFQSAYGGWLLRRKGTADRWTPLEQIWTAEKALKSRGFYPWPNTARACGLL
jgi:hypothetical protein